MRLFQRNKPSGYAPQPGIVPYPPGHKPNVLGDMMTHLLSGNESALVQYARQLQPEPLRRSLVKGLSYKLQSWQIEKDFENQYWKSELRARQAAEQGSVVNATADYYGAYDWRGLRDRTGTTWDWLRMMSHAIEPVAAIIGKRVNQVRSYSRRTKMRRGRTEEPGFMVVMSDSNETATELDKQIINHLEKFILHCGYGPPPAANRRKGWQPGFDQFLAEIVRDSLTLDHVAVRRWASATDPTRFPLVAFACEDAGRVRYKDPEFIDTQNGVPQFRPSYQERINAKEPMCYALVDDGGQVLEEFTAAEMVCAHRRPRTDRRVNGYGMSELEELIQTCTLWGCARDFNGLRFVKNSLPRGVMVLMGNISDQQYSAFEVRWKQMCEGVSKAFTTPVVRGTAEKGANVQWVPFDMSPKDMEHQTTMFTMAIWAHAIYQIHPDETGFSATSPFRPPLSEASPETNLKYSQDSGLRPLLRWIEDFINREILLPMIPSGRYEFKFVGVGDYDELQDVQVRTARLQAGLSTPEQEWAELDIVMPPEIAKHPAAKFPAPFAVGMQMIQGMAQQQQQAEMAQQQQGQQQQGQQFDQRMQQATAAQTMGDQMQEQGEVDESGNPMGGSPGGGGQGGQPVQGSRPVGTPPGIRNPASPVLKAIGWEFED